MSTSRDQLNRLLALVPYLQQRGSVPVAEVAREFGVAERVIRRDVNVLMMCGLPGLLPGDMIDFDFDAFEGEGVIRLSNADYLSRPLRLDSTEAAALMVALRTLREGATPEQREVVERTLAKIEAAAGESGVVAAQVQVQPPATPDEESTRQRLGEAVAAGRQVRLRYHSPVRDEETERVVDPIALASRAGHTYLDAWCHHAEDRRLFRVDRMTEVRVLDRPATEHADLPPLDLDEGIFRPSATDLLVRLRLDPPARWVTEYYPVERVEEEADGGVVVDLRIADPVWLTRLLLRLGGGARLLDDGPLRQAVQQAARDALRRYDAGARG